MNFKPAANFGRMPRSKVHSMKGPNSVVKTLKGQEPRQQLPIVVLRSRMTVAMLAIAGPKMFLLPWNAGN